MIACTCCMALLRLSSPAGHDGCIANAYPVPAAELPDAESRVGLEHVLAAPGGTAFSHLGAPGAVTSRRRPAEHAGENRVRQRVSPRKRTYDRNDECVQLRYSYLDPSPAQRIALAHLTQKMMPQSADRNQVGDVGV